jgi:hypothetical protein
MLFQAWASKEARCNTQLFQNPILTKRIFHVLLKPYSVRVCKKGSVLFPFYLLLYITGIVKTFIAVCVREDSCAKKRFSKAFCLTELPSAVF